MAHEVIFTNNEQYEIAHSHINPRIKLHDSQIDLYADNRMDRFRFSITPENPAFFMIREMVTEVKIRDAETNETVLEARILRKQGNTRETTEQIYWAEDVIAYLNDTKQKVLEFEGKPSVLLKAIVDRHNELVMDYDPHKQFAVGVCEIDTYKAYVDGNTPTDVTLSVGDNATIKPTTKYIWDDNGNRLNIASSVLGVKHTVDAVGTSGVFVGKYRLRHPNTAWGISGWIQAEDIIEAKTTQNSSQPNNTPTSNGGYPSNTQVKIKKGVRYYYKASDGTGRTEIKEPWLSRTYSTANYSQKYNRYAIVWGGIIRAWVNASDLDFGAIAKPSEPITGDKPNYIERERIITATLSYRDSSWDAIMENLLEPYGAEISWEYIEGVRTINIRNRVEIESDEQIRLGLNTLKMQESLDPSGIVTVIIPEGRLAKDGN